MLVIKYKQNDNRSTEEINQSEIVNDYTLPWKAQSNARRYFGEDAQLYRSTRKGQKFMILDPNTNKFVHFGALSNQDATKHNELTALL